MTNSVVTIPIILITVAVLAVVVGTVLCRARTSTRNIGALRNTTVSQDNTCTLNTGRMYCDANNVITPNHLYTSTPRGQNRQSSTTVIYTLSSNYYEPVEHSGEPVVKMENSNVLESNYDRVTDDRSSYIEMDLHIDSTF
jgi:hypothetical protein